MNKQEREEYLAAAERVLSTAGRSMHYTQIVAVADRQSFLEAKGPVSDRKMSSFLSMDIKLNLESRFVRERPGIYSLAENSSRENLKHGLPGGYIDSPLGELVSRTRLRDHTAVLNKALYLLGRTIDRLADSEVLFLENQSMTRRIDISTTDLIAVVETNAGEHAFWSGVVLHQDTLGRARHVANRLSLEDARAALTISLFLLDLALDVVEEESLLVLKSASSSIKIAIKSVG